MMPVAIVAGLAVLWLDEGVVERTKAMKAAALAALVIFCLRTGGDASAAERRSRVRPPCCYAHPQYAGVCVVHPGKGETCATILSYLNKPRSAGKSYCRNTTVRGGWTGVGCIIGDHP